MATSERHEPLIAELDGAREAHRRRTLSVTALLLVAAAVLTLVVGWGGLSDRDCALLVVGGLGGLLVGWWTRRGHHLAATVLALVVMITEIAYFHVFTASSEVTVAYVGVVFLMVATVRPPGWSPRAAYPALLIAVLAMRAGRWWSGLEQDVDAWTSHTFDGVLMLTCIVALALTDRRRTDQEGDRLRSALLALTRREEEAEALRRRAERAAKAERAANDAKSAFLLRISHELRTPLTAIDGYSELIGEDAGAATVGEDAARIREASGRLLQLVDAVLAITSAETGETRLEPGPTTLRELIAPIVARVQPLAAAGVELRLEVADEAVVVDVEQVRQVLLGLLGNAARFTERGTIRLTARADDALVTLRVADTGPGIAPEQLPLLFQPFSGPATQAGAGLGLAVCDRLVRVMGGTIEVQTVLGRGSTFTVRLPRLIP